MAESAMTFREEDQMTLGRIAKREFGEDRNDLEAFKVDVNEMLGLLAHLEPAVVERLRLALAQAFVEAADRSNAKTLSADAQQEPP